MHLTTKTVTVLAGAAALAVAAAAQAGPRGGGAPAGPAAAATGIPSAIGRGVAVDQPGAVNPAPSPRSEARENRQGPENASPTGVANANEHAGLSSTTASDLTGLKTGLTVKDSSGATIGTVRKIEKSKDGTIHNVLVASATGNRTIRLAPTTLSISGNIVTTTEEAPK